MIDDASSMSKTGITEITEGTIHEMITEKINKLEERQDKNIEKLQGKMTDENFQK